MDFKDEIYKIHEDYKCHMQEIMKGIHRNTSMGKMDISYYSHFLEDNLIIILKSLGYSVKYGDRDGYEMLISWDNNLLFNE